MASITRRELIRRLGALGFAGPFSGGRHQFMSKGRFKLRIPNPHQRAISVALLNELLRQAGIGRDEWEKTR